MQAIFSKFRSVSSLTYFQSRNMANFHMTQEPFVKMTQKDFMDYPKINRILKTNLQNRTKRSQFGLFHGKQPKIGHFITFSEKK